MGGKTELVSAPASLHPNVRQTAISIVRMFAGALFITTQLDDRGQRGVVRGPHITLGIGRHFRKLHVGLAQELGGVARLERKIHVLRQEAALYERRGVEYAYGDAEQLSAIGHHRSAARSRLHRRGELK